MSSVPFTRKKLVQIIRDRLGLRSEKAAANLPATTTLGIFIVSTGRVVVTSLIAEVVTAIQNQACNTKFVHTPTGGTVGDLCAVASIANLAVKTKFSLIGPPATAATINTAAGITSTPQILNPGTIGINTAATNTGTMKYTITWFPLDPGAEVVAA